MAMLIAPNGPSRDALLAALTGGDARSVSPEHDDFFGPALNAGAIVYAPDPPADPDRMRRVLGACNAPGVTLIVFVRPPGDAFEPEEMLLRRDGKPYVVLVAPPGSPALGPGLRRALSEGELQGRVLDLAAPAPAPKAAGAEAAPARTTAGRGDAAPDRDGAAKRAAAAPGPSGAASEHPDAPSKREPSPAGSGAAPGRPAASRHASPSPKAASSNDSSPERASSPAGVRPDPAAAWPRWLVPAATVALLVALQAMGVRVLPVGCSVPSGAAAVAPAPR